VLGLALTDGAAVVVAEVGLVPDDGVVVGDVLVGVELGDVVVLVVGVAGAAELLSMNLTST
jgi:hypothetical protein